MTRPYPKLIHPVPVTVRKFAWDKTGWDDKAREPIGHAVRDRAVVLSGQVKYKSIEEPTPEFAGVRRESKGYVIFRYIDLEAAGVTLERGDKITKIGNRNVTYFVEYFEDAAHYPDLQGAAFLQVWFVDRDPGELELDT